MAIEGGNEWGVALSTLSVSLKPSFDLPEVAQVSVDSIEDG